MTDLSSRSLRLSRLSNLTIRATESKNGLPAYYEFLVGKHVVFSTYGYKKAIAFAKGVEVGRSILKMEE